MTDQWAIETDNLVKRYGALEAVRGVNLRVSTGSITGFLGRNGAGKSSTIRMLLGISRATSGAGRVLGRPIDLPHENVRARRHVAYVAEDKHTYGYMTVGQMIMFTREFYDDWRRDVEHRLVAEYQLPLKCKVKTLSKGMRTKLALLLALARRPQLLILDEPSEGLDPVSIEELLRTLVTAAADGTTVFFSSHQISEVERIADHVCIIERGQIALDVSLDRLRQTYRRILVGFSDAPRSADFAGDNVRSIRTEGRQLAILATSDTDALIARAHSMGAVSVEASPMTLRELFLETVSEDSR